MSLSFDISKKEIVFELPKRIHYENCTFINQIAEKIRVANSAPLSPVEGDIYCDSVENALYIATD
jgi:hypothetical protein